MTGKNVRKLGPILGNPIGALLVVWAAFGQQTAMPPATGNRPLADRIASFENPERASWQKPDEIVAALKLKKGDVVADIGAGTGYFSRRFAKAVGPQGKVYAVDISADVFEYLKQEAEKQQLNNIETVVSRVDDPLLPKDTVDLAFFCDVTHHVANRVQFYKKLGLALKKKGRMAIIDYPPDSPRKPHKPEELVPQSQVIAEAREAGFKLVHEYRFLPRQYFLLFQKQR